MKPIMYSGNPETGDWHILLAEVADEETVNRFNEDWKEKQDWAKRQGQPLSDVEINGEWLIIRRTRKRDIDRNWEAVQDAIKQVNKKITGSASQA